MKVLSVRFKNLNSLLGEWKIDFTSPDYDGFFAITGPTGAGKSTILDAICLGLYGRTPRLNKVSKGNNEIMSRLTGECFSEVEFETEKGRFRCRWEQHRARRKPEGELQSPKHEICDAVTGQIYQTKSRNVLNTIEDVTGMDFDRFTRSMLLAQGDFSAFLQASADERSPILEQITGTEIYSKISQKVFERTRLEEQKLEELKAALGEIHLLDQEQEEQLKQSLQCDKEMRLSQKDALQKAEAELQNLHQIEAIQRQLNEIEVKRQKLLQEEISFQLHADRLERANDASQISPIYESREEKKSSLEHYRLEINEAHEESEALKQQEQKIGEELVEQQQSLLVIQGKEEKTLALFDQVLKMDTALKQLQADILSKEQEKQSITKDLKAKEAIFAKCIEKSESLIAQIKPLENYKIEHRTDESLCEALTGLRANIETYLTHLSRNHQNETNLKLAEDKLKAEALRLETIQKEMLAVNEQLQEQNSLLKTQQEQLDAWLDGRLLREYRAELESLEKQRELLRVIASLDEHRRQLKDGEACPLCGSLQHPYALENVPEPTELDEDIESLKVRIRTIEEIDDKCRNLAVKMAKIETKKREKEVSITESESKKSLLKGTCQQARDELEKTKNSQNLEKMHLMADLGQYIECPEMSEKELRFVLEKLSQRVCDWKSNEERLRMKSDELQKVNEEKAVLNVSIVEKQSQWETVQRSWLSIKETLQRAVYERNELFGQKDPSQERATFYANIEKIRESVESKKDEKSQIEQKLSALSGVIKTKKEEANRLKEELFVLCEKFTQALVEHHFSDEVAYKEACLSKEEVQKLQSIQDSLKQRGFDLETRETTAKEQLQKFNALKKRDITIQTLEDHIENQKQIYDDLIQKIGKNEAILAHNESEKHRLGHKQCELDNVKNTVQEWQSLRALIGSADGKKFRNFAQGLTFDVVIGYANAQLQRMSDRYLLIRGKDEPLQLQVVDNYQAGELRSTKNLSGGESFIVSLALALGLSSMASEKVSVDSLFLDEGFGTLDAHALEMALETLSQLREDGKLIGVISHVQALKDRIGTQIEVVPQSGGNSWLKGPGCERIAK